MSSYATAIEISSSLYLWKITGHYKYKPSSDILWKEPHKRVLALNSTEIVKIHCSLWIVDKDDRAKLANRNLCHLKLLPIHEAGWHKYSRFPCCVFHICLWYLSWNSDKYKLCKTMNINVSICRLKPLPIQKVHSSGCHQMFHQN